jgi:hypothetical protein
MHDWTSAMVGLCGRPSNLYLLQQQVNPNVFRDYVRTRLTASNTTEDDVKNLSLFASYMHSRRVEAVRA